MAGVAGWAGWVGLLGVVGLAGVAGLAENMFFLKKGRSSVAGSGGLGWLG